MYEPDSLRKRVRVRFLFARGSEEGLLGTVNKQRQGIIVGDGILPFVLRNQVRFVRTWSSPYMTHWGQSLRTCVPGERVHLWQGVTHETLEQSLRAKGHSPFGIPAERVRTYAGKWQNFTISGVFFHWRVWYTRLSPVNWNLRRKSR